MLLTMMATTGTMWGQNPSVTMAYSGSSTTNMTGNNDAALVGLSATDWSVVGDKGSNSNFPGLNKAGDIRLYYHADGSNTITVTALNSSYTISDIQITYTDSNYSNGKVLVGNNEVTGTNGSYSINSTSFIITNGNTSNVQVRISSIVINYTTGGSGGSDPEIHFNGSSANIGTNHPVGTEVSTSFMVYQSNLTENIAFDISGYGALDPASVEYGADPTEVTWSYTPTTAGSFETTITATSGTASATYTIYGEAKDVHNVTITTMTNGSVTADPTSGIQGTNIDLTVTPDAGYALASLTVVDGDNNELTITNNRFQMPDSDVTVSATFVESSAVTVVDYLDREFTGVSGTSYSTWSGKVGSSGAVYAGNSAGGNNAIQLRTSGSTSGIVSTTSAGNITKVEVDWNTNTASGRKIRVYGKNTTYSSAEDLYSADANTRGTLIGTINYGSTTTLTINDAYAYIGICSDNSALYLNWVKISWSSEESPTPSYTITNNNPIAYNATSGSFNFTVNNPVEGGSTTVAEDVDWISDVAISGNSVTFNTTANEGAQREGIITLTYTYNTTETVTKEVTITQVAAPVVYNTIPELFAAATSTETSVEVTFNNWVVSGVATSGRNIFVTDNNGNGFVIFYSTDMSSTFAAGDVLNGTAVSCTLKLYNGFAELLNVNANDLTITEGGTVTAATVAMADLTGVNTGALLHYDNLTCSVNGGKYYLSDGTTTLQVYNALFAFDALEDGKNYNITGVYQQYNNTKEILPRSADDIEEVVPTVPTVTVANATVNIEAEGGEGTLTVTYENITNIAAEVYFCDSEGAAATYDWIQAEINNDNNVYYLIDANDGEARTAYLKVYALDDNAENVYSNLVTINQDEYVAPTYAELPFSFNGGRADIEDTDGLYQEGLGTDYSSAPKLKFDHTGDWLLLQFQERPGTLTFDIKNNSFSGGTFTVQTSENGVTYTDLQAYTEITGTQNEEFTDLGENVRYIKWIYTEKSNGNVGLGNIVLAAYTAPVAAIILEEYAISAPANGTNGSMTVTLENMTISDVDNQFSIDFFHSDGSDFEPGEEKPDWVHAEFTLVNNVYSMNYTVDDNQLSTERNAYFKVYGLDDDGSTDAYSELVTVTQDGYVAPVAAITLEEYAISAPAAETEGTLTVTLENMTITNVDQFSIDFFHQDGSEFEPGEEKPDWVHADFTLVNNVYSMNYTVDANTEATERNAYFKVYGLDDDGTTDAYSELVTVTQAGYVVDYAELPFEWEGGPRSEFEALTGTSTYSVGDYTSETVYCMKLDATDDYIQIKTNEQPGIVTIGVKMVGGASTSHIIVKGSSDGDNFTDVEDLTISGAQNSTHTLETTNDFATTDRYVRLYFNKGSNVGVGPITIAQVDLTPSITVAPASLNLNCDGGDGELTVTHKNLADDPQLNVIFVESDGETITTCDWIQASINTAGNVAGHINANTGEARTAYLKVTGRDTDNNLIKSNLVTFNQSAYTEPSIVFENTTLDIVAGGENRTMSFDYEGLGQDPIFSINFYESDGTTTATYDWIEAEITQDDKVDITVSANEGAARSAYFKVSGVNGEVNALSNLVTINQAAFVQLTTYSLVTSVDQIVSGKHYVIANGTTGDVKAMGSQATNNRNAVVVSVNGNTISETEGMYEFVINGPQVIDEVSYFTIYDTNENSTGYLYAAGAGGSGSSNHLKTRATIGDDGKGIWTIGITNNKVNIIAQATGRNTMRYNSSSNCFSCYASGQQDIYLYVKDNDIDLEYYGGEVAYPGNSIPDGGSITVGAGSVMTVPDNFVNDYPEALVIQEGGQLIHTNPDGVNATLQKVVEAYTPANRSGDGWYMIATPVDNLPKTAVASTSDFDLFLYNEPNAMWYAHWDDPGFETLYRGKGYLYANAADVDLNYAGLMKATDAEFSVPLSYECDAYPDMKGFNLVGNPFTRNLVLGDMKLGGATLTQFYVVNSKHTGLVTIDNNSYEIKPGEGFFVQATDENQTLEFNPSTKGLEDIRFIKIVAGNENGYDNAYINIGCGNTLRKTNIANLTSVYVMDQGLDYAATRVEELAGNMPVHFAPSEDGFFTITVEAKNIENINFMHLIDNIENTAINLLAEPTYTFKAGTSDNEDRFTLVFDFNNYLGVNENNLNDSFVYQSGDELILNGEGTLQVFDMMGRFVMSKEISGSERISTSTFETGVYVLRFVGETVMTQKIVIE